VRGQLVPVRAGGASPWLWAGPVRAWAVEHERKGRDGKSDAGLWVCCKHGALLLCASSYGTASSAHVDHWLTGDGLLLRFAAEIIAGCREHREPKSAAKLYNTIVSQAWGSLSPQLSSKYGLKRDSVLYERHTATYVIEALHEAGYDVFAQRLRDERKKVLEERKLKQQQAASLRPGWPVQSSTATIMLRAVSASSSAKTDAPWRRSAASSQPASSRLALEQPAAAPRVKPPLAAETGAPSFVGSKRPASSAPKGVHKLTKPEAVPLMGFGSNLDRPLADTANLAGYNPREPDDAAVAQTMLAALQRANALLSLGQVAQSARKAHPQVPWNSAKWQLAVQRGLSARSQWFTVHGCDMLSASAEGSTQLLAPESCEASLAGGVSAESEVQTVETHPRGASSSVEADNVVELEDELFGDLGDL